MDEILPGVEVVVGYRDLKKRKITVRKALNRKDAIDYARFWRWAIKEGVVWKEIENEEADTRHKQPDNSGMLDLA